MRAASVIADVLVAAGVGCGDKEAEARRALWDIENQASCAYDDPEELRRLIAVGPAHRSESKERVEVSSWARKEDLKPLKPNGKSGRSRAREKPFDEFGSDSATLRAG